MREINMDTIFNIQINMPTLSGGMVKQKNNVKFLPHITPSPEIPAAKITALIHTSRLNMIFLSTGGSMIKNTAKQLSPLSTPSSRVPA